MPYAIEKSGQWWTGSCWGVREAREEYDGVGELPSEIAIDNSYAPDLAELHVHSVFPLNVRYYASDATEDALAVVREI